MPAPPGSMPASPRLASLGWGFGNGMRAEIEGNYRANDVHKIRGNLAPFGRHPAATTTRRDGQRPI